MSYTIRSQALDVWTPLFPVDPPFSTKLNFTKFILFPLKYVYSTYLCLKCCVSSLCLSTTNPENKSESDIKSLYMYFPGSCGHRFQQSEDTQKS